MSQKKKIQTIPCPKCERIEQVGYLGGNATRKYFCSSCCIEFEQKGKKITMHEISAGGTIT